MKLSHFLIKFEFIHLFKCVGDTHIYISLFHILSWLSLFCVCCGCALVLRLSDSWVLCLCCGLELFTLVTDFCCLCGNCGSEGICKHWYRIVLHLPELKVMQDSADICLVSFSRTAHFLWQKRISELESPLNLVSWSVNVIHDQNKILFPVWTLWFSTCCFLLGAAHTKVWGHDPTLCADAGKTFLYFFYVETQ